MGGVLRDARFPLLFPLLFLELVALGHFIRS
jgi:hypothetical protein